MTPQVKDPNKTKPTTQADIKNAVSTKVEAATPPTEAPPESKGIAIPKNDKSLNLTLQKIKELGHLAEKRESLISTQDKLNAFKLSTDKMQDVLTIRDSFGNKFETANGAIIADVLNLVKSSVSQMVTETETLIQL